MQEPTQNRKSLLESNDKGISSAKNPLALLFRQVLRDLKMQPYRWNQLMDRFLTNPRNGIPDSSRDRASARGNLNKELFKDKLTFGTLFRGLALLDPRKVRFELHCTWTNGKTTIHGVDVLTRRHTVGNGPAIDAMPDEIDELLQTGGLNRDVTVIEAPAPETQVPQAKLDFVELPVLPSNLRVPNYQSQTDDDTPPWKAPEATTGSSKIDPAAIQALFDRKPSA
ncbi:hypothetical protein [Stenotrophomonas sp. GD03657]|uniref:hypothetical protein n=1 Tax=Stenotrophomonas sp. GD03657 TaxID=2975363 RepID=UPI002449EB68|nr:hypothetical protein [Stenotrophomonas sp. GD03657]MDH2154268.1 hypothetical protein [Stenotrophomonas sp. GD03657]